MKNKKIYIFLTFIVSLCSIGMTHASSDKSETAQTGPIQGTQHPVHDHHETDHIKKLDEGIRRKRKDEK